MPRDASLLSEDVTFVLTFQVCWGQDSPEKPIALQYIHPVNRPERPRDSLKTTETVSDRSGLLSRHSENALRQEKMDDNLQK